jgi:hypothetical protein
MAPALLGMTTTGFEFLNSIVNSIANWMAFKFLGEDINWLRHELGLKPIDSASIFFQLPVPVYNIYSPSIVPKPRDWGVRDVHNGEFILFRKIWKLLVGYFLLQL